MNWIDQALGIHPVALSFRSQRSSVLAANIANSDTPGYLAKDYDFANTLKNLINNESHSMSKTQNGHIDAKGNSQYGSLMYRVPTKSSSMGNTVEAEVEQSSFADNALRYQTSLQFLNGSISGLRLAITGSR